MNITKLELCTRVSKRLTDTPVPVGYLKPVLETFLDEILNVLSEGRRIEIRGFGSFKTKSRKTRVGRNPRTGDTVTIAAYTAPAFKFSRDAVKAFSDKIGKHKKPKKETHKEVPVAVQPVGNVISTVKSAENFSL